MPATADSQSSVRHRRRRPGAARACVTALVALAGCVSVFEGTAQEIAVVTTPTDASCDFIRQGATIGTVPHTPGRMTVRKSKYDITVKCTKPGYQEAVHLNHSGTSAAIAANVAVDLILTAGLSSIIDSANGADNKYDSVVNVSLAPPPAPQAPATPQVTQ